MEYVFLAAACVSVLCVALICAFLLANGLPAMGEIGVLKFLSGTRWKPGADIYGIFPMIVGSVYVTAGALLLPDRACRLEVLGCLLLPASERHIFAPEEQRDTAALLDRWLLLLKEQGEDAALASIRRELGDDAY